MCELYMVQGMGLTDLRSCRIDMNLAASQSLQAAYHIQRLRSLAVSIYSRSNFYEKPETPPR